MSKIRKNRPPSSDDPTSLRTMRSAALQCLDCCKALSDYAKCGQEKWLEACADGSVQRLIDGLDQAIERGREIEREPRLTLGPVCTFGNITARNAHVAALKLGRKISRKIGAALSTHGTLATEEARASVYTLFGYAPNPRYGGLMLVSCNFEAWREAIESEADRAPRVSSQKPRSTFRSRTGQRAKNDELLEFDESERKKNPNLTDKEVLAAFRKKHSKHPIFESDDPQAALRAARSRRKKKTSGHDGT
jgi:hypothetical protein